MKKTHPLTIVSISAELAPYSKAGGLGDVARSLPKALHAFGHRVSVVTPLYEFIHPSEHRLTQLVSDLLVTLDSHSTFTVNVWKGELEPDLPIYFIDQPRLFGQTKRIYGTPHDNLRFYLFDVATLAVLRALKIAPDILQCHDWHTGLIPCLIRKRFRKSFPNAATVFTIHNLNYQLGMGWWNVPKAERDDGERDLPRASSKKIEYVNFAKRGIVCADVINTVSEQYAKEILTKEFGEYLARVLTNRQDHLFGIGNGIDYNDYNPARDPGLFTNYDADSLERKAQNKIGLQKMFRLPENEHTPLIGIVSRLSEQKGYDLLFDIIEPLMRRAVQLVIMGAGEKKYESFFRRLTRRYPKKVAAHLEFNQEDATKVYAGSDMFLMPSRFEPCGLGQLISLRYGSVPIVRAVGGLASTITDFNLRTGKGNGFVFTSYDSRDLLVAIIRAMEVYKARDAWTSLVKDGMRLSFSWDIPARKYIHLFRIALQNGART